MSEAIACAHDQACQRGGKEADRLAALARYGIVDTSPEVAFDRLVRLAAQLLDVPIALISLVDAKRQWFKARYGLDMQETPRTVAFCDHAIRGSELLVVQDAEQDERFLANPLVTGETHIRFYAGAPLVTADGFALGTLCTLDHAPRQFSAREAAILEGLAEQVVHELEVRAALGELYQEVSEGRHATRRLQSEEAKLSALLNATGNAVITATECGQVSGLNGAAELMFGLSSTEAVGRPIRSLIPTETGRFGSDSTPRTTSEGLGRREDGAEFPIELAYAEWIDAEGRRASGAVLRDITRRHELETQRRKRDSAERRQEKLAELGQMAGRVAHEINNLLQPVIGLTTLELDDHPPHDSARQIETRENLEVILDCGRQMRSIVRKVLLFSRKEKSELVERAFPEAMRRTLDFVGNLLPPGIQICADLDSALDDESANVHVLINQVELIEVISNLAINAAHAMNGVGRLSVALSRTTLSENAAALLDVSQGDYVRLSIADEGVGMDASTIAQIFNPFFTTKDVGEGTGLGLSTVYGVLRDWKGAIEVESVLGRGTVFMLYIPIIGQS